MGSSSGVTQTAGRRMPMSNSGLYFSWNDDDNKHLACNSCTNDYLLSSTPSGGEAPAAMDDGSTAGCDVTSPPHRPQPQHVRELALARFPSWHYAGVCEKNELSHRSVCIWVSSVLWTFRVNLPTWSGKPNSKPWGITKTKKSVKGHPDGTKFLSINLWRNCNIFLCL